MKQSRTRVLLNHALNACGQAIGERSKRWNIGLEAEPFVLGETYDSRMVNGEYAKTNLELTPLERQFVTDLVQKMMAETPA